MKQSDQLIPVESFPVQTERSRTVISFFLQFCENRIIQQLVWTTTCFFLFVSLQYTWRVGTAPGVFQPIMPTGPAHPVGQALSVCIKQTHCASQKVPKCLLSRTIPCCPFPLTDRCSPEALLASTEVWRSILSGPVFRSPPRGLGKGTHNSVVQVATDANKYTQGTPVYSKQYT